MLIKVLKKKVLKKLSTKKVFIVRDEALYFTEALGFSLPSLLVNPALVVGLFGVESGSGRARPSISKNCRASIGPEPLDRLGAINIINSAE